MNRIFSSFMFRVKNLAHGLCPVVMRLNETTIDFNACSDGPNPLASFIDACATLLNDGDKCDITWKQESGSMRISLNLDDDQMIHFDINKQDGSVQQWHEVVPLDAFVSAIKYEGRRMLNLLGLYGYRCSWNDDTDFPLVNLMIITGAYNNKPGKGTTFSDIETETAYIQKLANTPVLLQDISMSECVVYYEAWQLNCCGEPFSLGDEVEWRCIMPRRYKNVHGVLLDFEEMHHGVSSHYVKGKISRILAEWLEFPKQLKKAQREKNYQKVPATHVEIQGARRMKERKTVAPTTEDSATVKVLWGYIVELEDVAVTPIIKEKNNQAGTE